jgi:uncharacterized protein (TIGR03067 family)
MLMLTCATLLLGFAPAPFPRQQPSSREGDLQQMQGEWTLVSRSWADGYISYNLKTARIAGRRLTLLDSAGHCIGTYSLYLGPSKTIRLFDTKAEKGNYSTYGVYELSGDMLRVCYRVTPDERRRPISLDGSQAGVFLDVFKRRMR